MAAFDEAWWDARCLRFGKVHTAGIVTDGAGHVAWTRWRLIDELLRRFYVDFGLEPGFGLLGIELYNVALISPTCQRAPRYFGRLSGISVDAADASSLLSPLDGLPLPWADLPGAGLLDEGTWPTWSDYLAAAIRALGLAQGGVPGHEQCFHRRGKALTPLMYRVALLLRTNSGHDQLGLEDQMLTVADWDSVQHHDALRAVIDIISRAGGTIPPGPPRYIGVYNEIYEWIALRTDGWVATPEGPVDAAGLWRAGANEDEIAGAITEVCGG